MGRHKALTPDQVLNALQGWILDRGIPPTLEELAGSLKTIVTTRTLYRYLKELVDRGLLERLDGARGLRLLAGPAGGEHTVAVPFYGGASAGSPKLAEEDVRTWIRLPKIYLRPPSSKFFLIRIDGDSMNKAEVDGGNIDDGDLVLVQHQVVARPNQVVAVLVDGLVVIKKLIKQANYYVLMQVSQNTKHQPIIIGEEARVQGVVVRVFKKGAALIRGMDIKD